MRVLLAVDQSRHCAAAINFLANQEFALPIDLDIISVVVPLPYVDVAGAGTMGFGIGPEMGEILIDEQKFVEKRLIETASSLEGRCRSINSTVKIGSPAREIKEFADSIHADLIVMGAIGHSAISRLMLGSVSDYVATHATASTLVVRPQEGSELYIRPERILLAIGGSAQDRHLLDQLQIFDLHQSTEIHLVHVMQMMTFFRQDLLQRTSEVWKQSRASARQHTADLEESLKRRGFATQAKVLEEPHIGEALVHYSEKNRCQLILTCDQHRSVLDRAILGSTSRYVLRHTTSSTMIVRRPAD